MLVRELAGAEASAPRRGAGRSGCSRASDGVAARPCRGRPARRLAAKRRSCESSPAPSAPRRGPAAPAFAGVRRRRGTALPRAPGAASRGETALVRELAGGARPTSRGRPRRLPSSRAGMAGRLVLPRVQAPRVRPCAATASGSLLEDSSTTPQTSARSPKTGFPTPHNQAVRVSLTAARLTAITERTPGPARTVRWWSSLRWTPTSPWVRSSGHKAPPCHVLLPLAYRQ